MATPQPATGSKDDDREITADVPGLIDLVVDDQDCGRVKFWHMTAKGQLMFDDIRERHHAA